MKLVSSLRIELSFKVGRVGTLGGRVRVGTLGGGLGTPSGGEFEFGFKFKFKIEIEIEIEFHNW